MHMFSKFLISYSTLQGAARSGNMKIPNGKVDFVAYYRIRPKSISIYFILEIYRSFRKLGNIHSVNMTGKKFG